MNDFSKICRRRKFLNRLAHSFYDKKIVWKWVWQDIGDLRGKVVLDLGCGSGEFSYNLAQIGATVYGIDLSKELIALAKQNISGYTPSPLFIVMDAHSTAFPDNFFDFIFGNGILHHLQLSKAYMEIARILKPGGRAYFMEPLDRHPLVKVVRWLTPQARSADEKPLNFSDIEVARKIFKEVHHCEFFLLAVAASPFNLVSYRIGRLLTHTLNVIDRILFKAIPPIRNYAWITMIRLSK